MISGTTLYGSMFISSFFLVAGWQKKNKRLNMNSGEIAIISLISDWIGHLILIFNGSPLEVFPWYFITFPYAFIWCFAFSYISYFFLGLTAAKIGTYKSFITKQI